MEYDITICAGIQRLLIYLKNTEDERYLELLSVVVNSAKECRKEEIAKNNPNAFIDSMKFGYYSAFDHIELNHLDLYSELQRGKFSCRDDANLTLDKLAEIDF